MKCPECRKRDIELLTVTERIKNWFFVHLFSEEISDTSQGKFIQGFSDGYTEGRKHEREAQEKMQKLYAEVRPKESDIETLVNERVSKLLGVGDEKSIVTLDNKHGIIFIGGQRVDNARLVNLKSEAEFFRNSDLWKIISESPRDVACKAMFNKSQSFDDMKNGKSILYTLSLQNNILDMFIKYEKKSVDTNKGML